MTRIHFSIAVITIGFISSCEAQIKDSVKSETVELNNNRIEEYTSKHLDDGKPSISKGTVSNGSLINGKLIPFEGSNFQYFDTMSFLLGRAFVHSNVKSILLNSYKTIESNYPEHRFFIMETSNESGGKLDPHHTHQNGLSVDFMMPLLKNDKEYIGLDTMGTSHYFMTFDKSGRYSEDSTVQINFDIISRHILVLNQEAQKHGMKVEKVIINLELKDELYFSKYGEELKNSGVYIVKNLTPLINSIHDDHYHIDFGYLK